MIEGGESCLYFKRLADLDKTVQEQLVANSIAKVKRRYGARSGEEQSPVSPLRQQTQ